MCKQRTAHPESAVLRAQTLVAADRARYSLVVIMTADVALRPVCRRIFHTSYVEYCAATQQACDLIILFG